MKASVEIELTTTGILNAIKDLQKLIVDLPKPPVDLPPVDLLPKPVVDLKLPIDIKLPVVDCNNEEWNAEKHSSGKTINKTGEWKLKKTTKTPEAIGSIVELSKKASLVSPELLEETARNCGLSQFSDIYKKENAHLIQKLIEEIK